MGKLRFGMAFVLICLGLIAVGCGEEKPSASDKTKPTATTMATLNVPVLGAINTPMPMPNPLAQDDARLPLAVPSGADFEQAQALYQTHCAGCHGTSGQGQQPDPYAAGAAPPHNTDGHTWHHPDQANFATVWSGTVALGGKMPSFAAMLSEDEILLILGYIKGWWHEDQLKMQNERTVYFKTTPLQ